jgi:uncharacterized protein
MRRAAILIALMHMCVAGVDFASAQSISNMSIKCAAADTPYGQFCQRLKGLTQRRCGFDLQIADSEGSQETLNAPRKNGLVQLKLSQSDMMAYARREIAIRNTDPDDRKKLERWFDHRIVAALFPEQVHIVSLKKNHIFSVEDLYGSRVGIGDDNSGTQVTATNILFAAKVHVDEVRVGLDESLARLFSEDKDQKLAAFFFVGAAPVDALVTHPRSSELSFVRINSRDKYYREYKSDVLRRTDYKWMEDDRVDTLSTTAVLATYAYDIDSEMCFDVALIAKLMQLNEPGLHRNANEEDWRLNLLVSIPLWKRSECVKEYYSQFADDPADENQCPRITKLRPTRSCDCNRLRDPGARARCKISVFPVCSVRQTGLSHR